MCVRHRGKHALSVLNGSLVDATIALNVKAICVAVMEPEHHVSDLGPARKRQEGSLIATDGTGLGGCSYRDSALSKLGKVVAWSLA